MYIIYQVKPHGIASIQSFFFFYLEKQLFYVIQPNPTSTGNKCQKSKSEVLPFLVMTMRTDLRDPSPP